MQPQVRYVKSNDGTSLAVATIGEGQPLVMVPHTWIISIEGLWEHPEIRRNLERLAEKRKVVQYDCRGVGLSSRDVEDFSIPALEQDLEAVVNSLDLPAADLIALPLTGPIAISFAAHHPDRVRKLVLIGAVSRGRDHRVTGDLRADLIEDNWELYIQNRALVLYGWTEAGQHWAERMASDRSKEVLLKFDEQFRNSDVSDLLPQLKCPTLVMHWRERMTSMEVSRELAAAIPKARLVTFLQKGGTVWSGDWESIFAPAVAFLDEGTEADGEQLPEGTALILFADIVDSTALTERLGDAAFREKARGLDTALRAIIRENAGKPVRGSCWATVSSPSSRRRGRRSRRRWPAGNPETPTICRCTWASTRAT
jgi:pimeloyl-ACP methyl ester carboxylesterase